MKKIKNIDIHITDKCNLNCKYCNHFCPIIKTDEKYREINDLLSDFSCLARYSEIFCELTLMGGEPFLHPNLNEILQTCRQIFPDKKINLITNGTLYSKLYDLAPTIINNNIYVGVSLYPIPNSKKIIDTFSDIIPENLLNLIKLPKDFGFSDKLLKSTTNSDISKLLICPRRYLCTQFRNKKLYICQFAASLHSLKEAFPGQVNISEDNSYITFDTDTSAYEILNFLDKVIPDICKHCDDINTYSINDGQWIYYTKPWEVSEQKLEEFYK